MNSMAHVMNVHDDTTTHRLNGLIWDCRLVQEPAIILLAHGIEVGGRGPGKTDGYSGSGATPFVDYRMSVRERDAAGTIMIGGREVTPVAGAVADWVVEKITIINGIGMFIDGDPIIRRPWNLRELQPKAVGREMFIFS